GLTKDPPTPSKGAGTTRVTSRAVRHTAGRTTGRATTPNTPKARRPEDTVLRPAAGMPNPRAEGTPNQQAASTTTASKPPLNTARAAATAATGKGGIGGRGPPAPPPPAAAGGPPHP